MDTFQPHRINRIPQWIDRLVVISIRVLAHTNGPMVSGNQSRANHWPIYLVHSNGSVGIGLELDDPDRSVEDLVTVTAYPDVPVPSSAIRSGDFGTSGNLYAICFLAAIRRNERSKHILAEAEGGVDRRYWAFIVMADFVELNYVVPTSFQGSTMERITGYNYSINAIPVPQQVVQETFVQHSQSASAGSVSNGTVSNGSVSNDAVSNGTFSNGTFSNGTVSNGTVSNGTVSNSNSANTTSSQASLEMRENASVTVALMSPGMDVASSIYRFITDSGTMEKRGDQFFKASDQNGQPCMVYYCVASRRYYWTSSLDQPHP